jgi:serine/threonine protein kinase
MAPEILDHASLCKGYNPEQTDIFSLGVIFFSLFLGKPPFRQANPRKCELYKLLSEYKFDKFWELWDQKWALQESIQINPGFKDIFNKMTSHQP